MVQWLYRVEHTRRPDGHHVAIVGDAVVWASGPHASQLEAEQALLRVMRRWRHRAAALGGHAWRRTGSELGLLLPEEARPPRGARRAEHEPITRASPDAGAPWAAHGVQPRPRR